jgi:hypothetical protein
MSFTDVGIQTEEYPTHGEELLARVKELVAEGNVRRVIIRNGEGRTIVEVPLTVGVVGAALAPALAAVGAIAALVTDCSIEVERHADARAVTPIAPDDQVPDDQC